MHPMRPSLPLLLALLACVLFCSPVQALQVVPEPSDQEQPAPKAKPAPSAERESLTRHELRLDGKTHAYTATAGELVIKDEESQEPKARIFYVAYELENAGTSPRPLTFAFNGGPGAASVWLHLGGLGPLRVALHDDGTLPPPPYRLIQNESSWLPFTDIVFIDPVGTGYSRGLGEAKPAGKPFWNIEKDVESVAEFIRLWVTRNGRWLSPIFLAGESYGTTRAALLAPYLQSEFGLQAAGVLLISPVLFYETILLSPINDLPFALYLPAYASVAHYHGKAGQGLSLEQLSTQAGAFALEEYLPALAKGSILPKEQSLKLAGRLSELTGLPAQLYLENHLRLEPARFRRELLRDRARLIGRMDATIAAVNPEPQRSAPSYDPTLQPLYGPFSSAMHSYLIRDLKYQSDLLYEFLNPQVGMSWDWQSAGEEGQGYLDAVTPLKQAMSVSPSMRVLLACGMYDLATPCSSVEYTLNHLWLDDALKKNITLEYYRAGHMMYTHADARKELRNDAERFYRESLSPPNRPGTKPRP
ncbi:carboxypeptidase C (cathepsin A) [Desulfocurvibacter africanus PCS]|uniref:Carboxypeptidase C (Cathepsin A) n=1 Tax=Desulfocurvibacter africanus PCS TaxID=1262666 RepID=M5PWB4_DESAF|nr:carboxypeptidase C (cathepsin A) [Desulfocurvibacter africanus]EMG38349.1 carboxypeptidase C (cathepsin A) [Desulfocurvibacter africanus PCS]